ncbi:MAG TPA: transcription-repair coupling factor [Candidatus Ornithomonoglobus intestinigallinarum]|uniref:Transcription-repair-coupling factor n=1 Tax=Candidatus Ornithomonoglobus intestinigallinarum TaxID=2840894 RepID=A0A9D1H2H2_9FIRM|nr:transcription-repair coupling factor [Candidatus Ornithomonoglobus intestinigallinarum]
MKLNDILYDYGKYAELREAVKSSPVSVSGVEESARAQLIFSLFEEQEKNALIVCYSDMEARALADDLAFYTDSVQFFPSKEYIFYNIETSGRTSQNERLAALYGIVSGKCITVASLDALLQYTIPKPELEEASIRFELGKRFDIDRLCEELIVMGYSREELVEGEGQFALRGGILDVFSPNCGNPLRIEFFDDETDSIRLFDRVSQRSLDKTDSADIIPVREAVITDERRGSLAAEIKSRIEKAKKRGGCEYYIETASAELESLEENRYFPSLDKYVSLIYGGNIPSLLDYFGGGSLIFVIDPKRICDRGKTFEWEKGEIVSELKEKNVIGPEKDSFFVSYGDALNKMLGNRVVSLETLTHTSNDFKYKSLISFTTKTTVSFHGKMDYLFDDVKKWQENGYTVVILAATRGRGENLAGVLTERGMKARFLGDGREFKKGETVIIRGRIKKGFEYPDIKFVLVSDNEIFEQRRSRRKRKDDNAARIRSYNDISPGDYVVHSAHGIGEYKGTQKMNVGGVLKDYLKIQYRGTDCLYVPVDQMDQLYKYIGNSADKQVKLNRLGGNEWNKTKAKVRASTDELAKKLIALYAEREKLRGFAFSHDTPWQKEFEDTFPYQETEDQLRSIEEVKSDMEKPKPMDRLLCGDVGFGKTEIALRAAFKAVNDSKQVAYLCPTTVLAMQHYETFLKRMDGFPIKIEMLSRFRTASQQQKILKQLRTGEADIVIGTHRLLSKDVKFKDLGLLVIDEEQRFGVAHKERLKEIKKNVDVLTMTATPIPRTLHMAMTSVRDMSVLTEPPENRYPVQTYVLEDNPAVILDAVRNELSRGGQVFYLYNRVQGIHRKAAWLQAQFPDKTVSVGHGKMREDELEEIMFRMAEGDTDILVCTTIIETGLDIPNANTIIIENADKMGLAQLYQLRGRVGRSNRAAYAYLTYRRDSILSEVASKRLRAVKEFTEFGSGFKIAMRDLEIRGAGNLLGPEQHGHMDSVGYDMYCKLLSESISSAKGEKPAEERNVSIDIEINAYLPESYIPSPNQRIDMYKKIAAIENEDDRFQTEDELIDRYGDIPRAVQNIIEVASLKIKAKEAGITEIVQHGTQLTLRFADGYLTPEIIMALDKAYPMSIRVMSQTDPAVSVKLKAQNILEIVNDLLNIITSLDRAEK